MSVDLSRAATLPPPDWSRLSLIVRKARRQEQESLTKFGGRLGVDRNVIHALEQAKPVKVEQCLRVCAGLKLDPYVALGMRSAGEGAQT